MALPSTFKFTPKSGSTKISAGTTPSAVAYTAPTPSIQAALSERMSNVDMTQSQVEGGSFLDKLKAMPTDKKVMVAIGAAAVIGGIAYFASK